MIGDKNVIENTFSAEQKEVQRNDFEVLNELRTRTQEIKEEIDRLSPVGEIYSDLELSKLDPDNPEDAQIIYNQELRALRNYKQTELDRINREMKQLLGDSKEVNGGKSFQISDGIVFEVYNNLTGTESDTEKKEKLMDKAELHNKIDPDTMTYDQIDAYLDFLLKRLNTVTQKQFDTYSEFRNSVSEKVIRKNQIERNFNAAVFSIALDEYLNTHYDELLTKKELVDRELEKYNLHTIQGVVEMPPSVLSHIVENWKNRVRQETNFFKELDVFGVEIFKDNLIEQPAFQDLLITHDRTTADIMFSYGVFTKLEDDEWDEDEDEDGDDFLDNIPESITSLIELRDRAPSLKRQVAYFIEHGNVDEVTKTLLHEFFHYFQHKNMPKGVNSSELNKEAQAFMFELIFCDSSGFTNHYKDFFLYQSSYDFPEDKEKSDDLLDTLELQGLGLGANKISGLYNQDSSLQNIKAELGAYMRRDPEEMVDGAGFDEELFAYQRSLFDSLKELYLMTVKTERKKALLLLSETVSENVEPQDLDAAAFKYQRSHFVAPEVALPHDTSHLEERFRGDPVARVKSSVDDSVIVMSDYEQVPEKSGIVIRLEKTVIERYTKKRYKKDEKTKRFQSTDWGSRIQLGKFSYNTVSKTSDVVWADNEVEYVRICNELREHAPVINKDEKLRFLQALLQNSSYEYREFVKSLVVNKEEAAYLIEVLYPTDIIHDISQTLEKVRKTHGDYPAGTIKIDKYNTDYESVEQLFEKYLLLCSLFDVEPTV